MDRLFSENGCTHRNGVLSVIIFLGMLCYGIKTEFLTNIVSKKSKKCLVHAMNAIEKNSPVEVDNLECDRKVHLADYDELKVVFLNSFPGSGNT